MRQRLHYADNKAPAVTVALASSVRLADVAAACVRLAVAAASVRLAVACRLRRPPPPMQLQRAAPPPSQPPVECNA